MFLNYQAPMKQRHSLPIRSGRYLAMTLLTLLMLPFSAKSQSIQTKAPSPRMEIGLNLGYAPDNSWEQELWRGGYIRSALSLLKNVGVMQYGLIEGGTNSSDYWYVMPGIIANRKFTLNKAYFYAGAMAGYVCSDDMMGSTPAKKSLTHGYVLGLQGGLVQPVGKHMAFTTELAVRRTQSWMEYEYDGTQTRSDIILYFPITIGLRYRW